MRFNSLVRRTFAAMSGALLFAPVAFAQYTGTVDFTTKLQSIDGFGMANPFGRSQYVVASPLVRDQIIDQFFNPLTGAGLTMLRLGIDDTAPGSPSGIVIVPNAPASPSTPPVYVWDNSAGGQVWFGQQALKYGMKRFYATSWSAPGYMKTNNNINSGGAICGTPGATCASGDWRQAYADYLVQFTRLFQHSGVPVTDVAFTNEPNGGTSYASMVMSATQSADFLKLLGPTFQSSGTNVNLTCCEVYGWPTVTNYTRGVTADPLADSYVAIYTGHEYGGVANVPLPTPKKQWMSEYASANNVAFNRYWDKADTVYSTSTANNGMFLANDITNAVVKGNVSAFMWWYGTSTGNTGALIQMSAASDATSILVTKRLFALGHFARYVHPGAYRVPMTTTGTNLNVSAFINPDGSKVINVVNNDTAVDTFSLTLDGGTANWTPTATFTDENNTFAASTATTVGGTTLTSSFPPRSMTTIVLAAPAVQGTVQLVVTPALQTQADGSYLGTVTVSNTGTGTAQNVTLNGATLGGTAGSTMPTAPMPFSVGSIAPGSFATMIVNFPAGQAPGTQVIQKYTGSYSGGTFGGSLRTVLPTLP